MATLGSSTGVVAMTAKKIVICLDGTGNQMKAKGHTNVATVYEMLDLSDPAKQLGYYDPGVGTMSAANARGRVGRWFSRMCGLAFGSGLKTNVAEAYTFLMQHWLPGDEVYVFGFSRGAYTARALVGMLNRPGLLRPGSENLVPYAIAHYATNKTFSDSDKANMREFSHAFCWGTEAEPLSQPWDKDAYEMHWHSVPVAYVGVWDTVKAAGILRFGDLHWPFTHQLFNAAQVRHAVSIDEYRRPYREYPVDHRHYGLDEAWFAGVHSDVGGTFEDDPRLAKIALKWIVDGTFTGPLWRAGAYARECPVDESFAEGTKHKMGWIWFLVGTRRRTMPDTAKLHASVRARRTADPGYLPKLAHADSAQRWLDPNWLEPAT
ncbi:MAG: hypothetical protein QOI15_1990 [Pseudonocardiales bacterium]|nr:hypothetical protein [Pseudonocardiales bacterium]